MKGWVGLVGWSIRTVYPHKWSRFSYRSSAGQGKFAGEGPTFDLAKFCCNIEQWSKHWSWSQSKPIPRRNSLSTSFLLTSTTRLLKEQMHLLLYQLFDSISDAIKVKPYIHPEVKIYTSNTWHGRFFPLLHTVIEYYCLVWQQACFMRGLNAVDVDIAELRQYLTQWVQISSGIGGNICQIFF